MRLLRKKLSVIIVLLKYDFISMYGGDFEKFDEFNPLISKSQGKELKAKIKKEG